MDCWTNLMLDEPGGMILLFLTLWRVHTLKRGKVGRICWSQHHCRRADSVLR